MFCFLAIRNGKAEPEVSASTPLHTDLPANSKVCALDSTPGFSGLFKTCDGLDRQCPALGQTDGPQARPRAPATQCETPADGSRSLRESPAPAGAGGGKTPATTLHP